MSFRTPSVIVYQEFLDTVVEPATPFMDLCIVGPIYQCENDAEMDDYSIHVEPDPETGVQTYKKEYPNLKVGAQVDVTSPYLTLSNVNVKVWPNTDAQKLHVIVDNSGPVTIIRSWPGTTGEESLEGPNTIKVNDIFDLIYTDKETNKQVVSHAAISIIEDYENPETHVIEGKKYILTKNLLNGVDTAASAEDVEAGKVEVFATVKRTVEGDFTVLPSQTSEQAVQGFKCDENYLEIVVGGLKLATSAVVGGHNLVVDCNVKVSYRALRMDANDFITVSNYADAIAKFGKPNINNPMSVACQVINSAVGEIPYKVLPITSDDLSGYLAALDTLSTSEDIYCIEPLTHDKQVIDAYVNHCNAMSEPLKSKWRIIYGNIPIPATKVVVEENKGVLMTMGSETEAVNELLFNESDADWGSPDSEGKYHREFTLTTDFLSLYQAMDGGYVRVPELGGTIAYSFDQDTKILSVTTDAPFTGKIITEKENFNYEEATCYVKDIDTNVGGFISGGANINDFVDIYELNATPSGAVQKTYRYSLRIKQILTDSACICFTKKWVRSADSYMPIDKYQHFIDDLKDISSDYKDLTDCMYEVVRILDTSGTAEVLGKMAKSYNTRRFRFVQPDQVEVTVNSVDYLVGSEYLCVALGAMRSAFPPHQGFSTMGISGITRVANSHRFNEDQLADMASNGVFWVSQDSTDTLPYVLYQTTTDTSEAKKQEDSICSVVDFASKFYKRNLQNVVGRYNVNNISLNYCKTVINSCSNSMTSTNYEYLGPILNGATLVSLTKENDKIKPVIKLSVPFPVNGVDITLQV